MRWLISGLALTLGGCAHYGTTLVMKGVPSAPIAIAASTDEINRYVRATSALNLVVSLRISGSDVSLASASVVHIPRRDTPRIVGNHITVSMLAAGSTVAQVTVPDPVEWIVEGSGAYRAASRTAIVALPLAARADAIQVEVSVAQASAQFPVASVIADFCSRVPAEPLCVYPQAQGK